MIKGKIEHGVPLPRQARGTSTFHRDFIGFLDKLEVNDSVVFQLEKYKGYIFDTKIRPIFKIYGIIKDREFTACLDIEKDTVRVWRVE